MHFLKLVCHMLYIYIQYILKLSLEILKIIQNPPPFRFPPIKLENFSYLIIVDNNI